MVTTQNTDPTKEAEFNAWYDDVDIPDVLQVPGYLRARRGLEQRVPGFSNPEAGQRSTNYVALYDIESRAIDKTIIDMLMASWGMEKSHHSTDLLKVTERVYFHQYSPAYRTRAARSSRDEPVYLHDPVRLLHGCRRPQAIRSLVLEDLLTCFADLSAGNQRHSIQALSCADGQAARHAPISWNLYEGFEATSAQQGIQDCVTRSSECPTPESFEGADPRGKLLDLSHDRGCRQADIPLALRQLAVLAPSCVWVFKSCALLVVATRPQSGQERSMVVGSILIFARYPSVHRPWHPRFQWRRTFHLAGGPRMPHPRTTRWKR